MLNFCRAFLLLTLGIPLASAWAGDRGMTLNPDGLGFFFQSNVNDTVFHNSRQKVSLLFSKEQDPRNMLLRADAELLDYQHPVLGIRTLSPETGVIYGNSNNKDYLALMGGAIIRQPRAEDRDYEWLAELFIAPHLANQKQLNNDWKMDFKWTWGLRVQVNYALPDKAELNVGFRKIMVNNRLPRPSSFDTGLYLGLSYRF